jgi:hypothetical protein
MLGIAVLVAASALVVLAGSASAAVPAASKAKFCKAVADIPGELGDVDPSDVSKSKEVFKDYAAQLKHAAKNAPKSIKKAADTLASFYKALGSGDLTALTKTKNFGSAAVKFGQYVSENCSGTS